jgi:hypothetical protein
VRRMVYDGFGSGELSELVDDVEAAIAGDTARARLPWPVLRARLLAARSQLRQCTRRARRAVLTLLAAIFGRTQANPAGPRRPRAPAVLAHIASPIRQHAPPTRALTRLAFREAAQT